MVIVRTALEARVAEDPFVDENVVQPISQRISQTDLQLVSLMN